MSAAADDISIAAIKRRRITRRKDLAPPNLVLDRYLDPTGTGDVTSALQAAIDAIPTVNIPDRDGNAKAYGDCVLPAGTYRIDGSIYIRNGRKLKLSKGAILRRVSAASSTDPVVYVSGQGSELQGGAVITEKASPNGVVVCGHETLASSGYVGYWRLQDCEIRGVRTAGNYGVVILNSQSVPVASSANYFGLISRINIREFGVAILIAEMANAHYLEWINVEGVVTSALDLRGCYGNVVNGIWHNTPNTSGAYTIRLLNKTSGSQDTVRNTMVNVHTEPGPGCKGVYQESNAVLYNCIQGNINVSAADVWVENSVTNQQNSLLNANQMLMAQSGYTFLGDSNTGLNRPGSDLMGFLAGGVEMARLSTSGLAVARGTNAQTITPRLATTSVNTSSGATVTATNLIPAGAMVIGVTTRVTTAITGATSFQVGDGTDPDRWGAAIAVAINTTSTNTATTVTTPTIYPGATSVVLTANGGNFSGGAVRITVHYIEIGAPTS